MDNEKTKQYVTEVTKVAREVLGAAQRVLRSVRRGDADVESRYAQMLYEGDRLTALLDNPNDYMDAKDAGAAEAEADA